MSTMMLDDQNLQRELNELLAQQELRLLIDDAAKTLDEGDRRYMCRHCRWDFKGPGCFCVPDPPFEEIT